MFKIGQQLICEDDQFHPRITEWCEQVPRRNEVYTIREITSGYCRATGMSGPGFRFEELDNRCKDSGEEACFADWRFNPLDDFDEDFDTALGERGDWTRSSLREPEFLIWLTWYTGEWRVDGTRFKVRQRPDGWLEAIRLSRFDHVPLQEVISEDYNKYREPKGPLGPTPVLLSDALMACWLTGAEQIRLESMQPGIGRQRLIRETIEKCILAVPEPEREARWVKYWKHNEPHCPISHRDLVAHLDLEVLCRDEAAEEDGTLV